MDSPHKLILSRRCSPPAVPKKPKNAHGMKIDLFSDNASTDDMSISKSGLLHIEDLTKLPLLYPKAVLDCVQERFFTEKFYTWAGPTLVAVNPCSSFSHLYDSCQVEQYHAAIQGGLSPLPPHVYAVAGVAEHRRLCGLGHTNQSVVVSGESGAGKTESARYILGYLCQVEDRVNGTHLNSFRSTTSGSSAEAVVTHTQSQVLASNPLLEAFGNAATLRNHNSSRFGKLLRLQYGGGSMRGATIDTYLLEKTRVTHQPPGERNFHILHQVVAGLQWGVLEYDGSRVEHQQKQQNHDVPIFNICSSASATDVTGLHVTLEALDRLGFSFQHQNYILQVLVAILHLGNVNFVPNESTPPGCDVAECSLASLSVASGLLGVTTQELTTALTVRIIAVPTRDNVSVFRHPCERRSECCERRDACLQLLYAGLFAHLVATVNEQTAAALRQQWDSFLGVLDIYGFEVFENNSLEQLCINYANERLQHAFTQVFLRTEQQVLLEEGVLVEECLFADNSGCLAALHSPVSVFAILNEECQLHRTVDEVAACERVCRALHQSAYVCSPDRALGCGPGAQGFVVRHYAGPVLYSPHALLTKNKDLVPVELVTMLSESHNVFVATLVESSSEGSGDSGDGGQRQIVIMGARDKNEVETRYQTVLSSRWNSSPTLSLSSPSLPEFNESAATIFSTNSLRRPPKTPTPDTPGGVPYGTGSLSRSSTPTTFASGGSPRRPSTPTFSTPAGSSRRSTRKVTTLSKFKVSLDALLKTLNECDLHYVRCVKPNKEGRPGRTHDDYLLAQLSACGILDTVTISQAGYPVRMNFEEFCARYSPHSVAAASETAEEETQHILSGLTSDDVAAPNDSKKLYMLGKRRIFLSEAAFRQLEKLREQKRSAAACVIQTNWRRTRCELAYRTLLSAVYTVLRLAAVWRSRRRFLRIRQAVLLLQRHVRGVLDRNRYQRMRTAAVVIQRNVRMWRQRRIYVKILASVVLLQRKVRKVLGQRLVESKKIMASEKHLSTHDCSLTSSFTSVGYHTGSVSLQSFDLSPLTPSPDDPTGKLFGSAGTAANAATDVTAATNALPSLHTGGTHLYLDAPLQHPHRSVPQICHQRSLLETEESGIETDTESMSGAREAAGRDDQARRRRRRAKLQQSLRLSGAGLAATGVDGLDVLSSASENTQNERACAGPSTDTIDGPASGNRRLSATSVSPSAQREAGIPAEQNSSLTASHVTYRRRKRKSIRTSESNLVRITRAHQMKTVLEMFHSKPEMQYVYTSDDRDIFFKDGLISCRSLPTVRIRFHVRATCLPYSHRMPRALQPQGLLDAL